MPEVETSEVNRKRRKRGREKKQKQKQPGQVEDDTTNSTANPPEDGTNTGRPKSKRKSERKRSQTDRYFGLFHCKKCDRTWQSAHVYTVAGTYKVLWKQRCKQCSDDDAWVFPFGLQLIECRVCQEIPCICICEECGKLKHRPTKTTGTDPTHGSSQSGMGYCRCRKKKRDLGDGGDLKKPHLRDLCGRCKAGLYCGMEREED